MKPLAFFSRKLTATERKYSTFDRELLAVYASIKHFRDIIKGRTFQIYTDHKPLVSAIQKRTNDDIPRRSRQMEFITQFTSDIRHIEGCENIPADVLSRIESFFAPTTVPYDEIAIAQKDDNELQLLRTSSQTNLQLQDIEWEIGGKTIKICCDTTNGRIRPYIPPPFRKAVFDSVHNLTHPGPRVTTKLVSRKFVWSGMNEQCGDWARTSLGCQRAKIGRHTTSPLGEFRPCERFKQVHMDIMGPLLPSQGMRYVMTMIDWRTRWPEAYPTNDIIANNIAKIIVNQWMPRFGVPSVITTDQGR